MKFQFLRQFLAVLFLFHCAWPRNSVAQAAIADSVLVWGSTDQVPLAAQSGVTAIAAGGAHTVALKNDGSVVAWGNNNFGPATIPLAAQNGVTAIAAGGVHSVALKNDGTVMAWGDNYSGQVTGTPSPDRFYVVASPVTLGGQVLSGVTAIAAGDGHTVALKNDGSVAAWGRNNHGQTTVPVAARSGVTAIAAGVSHTVTLKNDGSVVAWGRNDDGQTTVPVAARSGVTAIAAGVSHTVALKNDGSVVAWGANRGLMAIPLAAQSGVVAIAARGGGYTVALKNDGTVVGWDNSGLSTILLAPESGASAIALGGMGTVALVIPTAPKITTHPLDQTVNLWRSASFTVAATGYPLNYQWRKDGVDLAGATSATYSLSFALTNHAGNYTVVVSNSAGSVTSAPPAVLTVNPVAAPGTVVAWGWNDPTVPVAAQSGIVAIAASRAHTVALKDDGSVVVWGIMDFSQTNVLIAAQSRVMAIAAGGACDFRCNGHTVALQDDGTVVAWGRNDYGQVTGTPTTDGYPYFAMASPVTLGGQVLSGVTAIAAELGHTVALKSDGTVVAWGRNDYGQVTGTPTTDGYPYFAMANPVTLGGQVLSGVTAIAAEFGHTVALKNDGTVVAWGRNDYGQVTGTPTTDGYPYFAMASPVTLGGQVLSGVTAIAAEFGHTVALKNDGMVVAWGRNDNGQVTGTPTTEEPYSAIASPVTLGGQVLSGVTAVATGWGCTIALKNDGTLVAWGDTSRGQVTGIPTTDTGYAIANPVTLGGQVLSGVTAIAAGPYHTVALLGGVPLLPSLKARPDGDELLLSWPTNAVGFTLQSTPDLTSPVTWLDSTSVPAVIGAHFTLTNSASAGARLYRLRKR